VSFQNNLAGLDRILDVLDVGRGIAQPLRWRSGCLVMWAVEAICVAGRFRSVIPNSELPVLRGCYDRDRTRPNRRVGWNAVGAGKTTLTNLGSLGFTIPTEGAIFIHNRDLRDIRFVGYRRCSNCRQDVFLFDAVFTKNTPTPAAGGLARTLIAAAAARRLTSSF